MTTSLDLLQLVYNAVLQGPTAAEERVYKPGDWPTQDGDWPIIKMRLLSEDRLQISRNGAVEFNSTATIRIHAEVSAPATVDDAGATGAESALWALKRQIEVAVINSYPLTQKLQGMPFVRSQLDFTSEGATHLAGIRIDIALEFYEGSEDFAPVAIVDLEQITLADTEHPPIGADLPNLQT